jgi:hypothetical protein
LPGHPKGTEASATFLCLIETTKANNLKSNGYLLCLLTNLPQALSEVDFLNLLPSRVNQADIDAAGKGAGS